ncbi:TerB family tellurite resistance protein [Spirulina subsalsa]|uniref:tellurite resistance TerB family protein n=1 Tax=Spirulina subsalsa TaxID=54311 RepID=UPI0002FB2697|nr:TerB family tellurite resistance protein [Spirulina subsalsa]
MNIGTRFDTDEIAASLNDLLEFFDLTVSKVSLKGTCLMIMIEAADVPDQDKSIKLVRESLTELSLESIEKIKVYGKKQGNTLPDWDQVFLLESSAYQDNTSSAIQSTIQHTQNPWQDMAGQTASEVAKNASKTWDSIINNPTWNSIHKTATEAARNVSETIDYSMDDKFKKTDHVNPQEPLDLAQVPEVQRIAFYGALFAIALADGTIDKEEMELIFGMMDLEGMSEKGKRLCLSFIIEAPPFEYCLQKLKNADERLRYGLMVNLLDVAWVNNEIDEKELKAISLTQKKFNITNEQVVAISKFVKQVQKIREGGLDDNKAADAMKTATAGLSAVGVPIAAVWFSGSVIGLSAAGITSGLAALGALVGLGGMIPGIGVAILLGTGIFLGVNKFLDTGDKRKKEALQAERERKAQLVIQNLQASLNRVIERMAELTQSASQCEANKQAILILNDKMKKLQQLVNKRKNARH